jgi:cation transport regulator
MPYSKENPPDRIKALPAHAQEIWIAAFNSALSQYKGDEGKANATAWAAVEKAGYKKGDDGKWSKGRMNIQELWESVKRLFEPHLQEATPEYTVTLPTQSRSFVVTRQADGKARWLMIAASATINKANSIDSTILFDNFIKHARDSGEYPILDFLHEEDTLRFGVADWLQRDGALYLASGTFDDTDIGRAAAAGLESQPDYWGASISYRITEPPMILMGEGEIPVYTDGINRYISIVPKRMAANLFTATVVTEEVMRMDKRAYDELVKLVGETEAQRFAALVDDSNRTITEVGMVTRTEEPTTPEATEEPKPTEPAQVAEAKLEPERAEVVVAPPQEEQPPAPTLADVIAKVNELTLQVAELKAAYGMVQESSTRATEEQTRAVSALDELKQRLAPVEALSIRWQQWLDDVPESVKGVSGIVRARDTEPAPMTMAQIAEQNLSKMNRGPHSRRQ